MPTKKTDRKQLNLSLYKTVHLIRAAEEAIQKHYYEDEMKTPMHMSMGQEAISAGICHALGPSGQVFGYYRSHALYIAKTQETKRFFGEMYGKVTGTARGKGGSMHLASPKHGLLLVSAVVASTIAPAVGAAFANKQKKNKRIVAAFFGDGAIEEGVFFESLNVACLMKLSIIFVCEDNGLAMDATARERQGFSSIPKVVSGYDCHILESTSTDAEEIYHGAVKAIDLIKKTKKPVFMHLKYYRELQHVGVNSEFDPNAPLPKGGFEKVGYRSQKEHDAWMKKDPVKVLRAKLIGMKVPLSAIEKIEKANQEEVEQSIKLAKKAPFPKPQELFDNVYAN